MSDEQIIMARSKPIDGRYRDLGEQTRYLMGYFPESGRPFLTTRMAARKTGVNHATISTMLHGDRPSEESIRKFAAGLGGDVNSLLVAAGYLPDDFAERERSLFQEFADVERFDVEPRYRQFADPADPDYADYGEVISKWAEHGAASAAPLLPHSNRAYKRSVLKEYLEALKTGDRLILEIESRYKSLFMKCVDYTRVVKTLMSDAPWPTGLRQESPETAQWKVLFREIRTIQEQNTLALVGWYEQRHDDHRKLPSLPDLVRYLSLSKETLESHLIDTGKAYDNLHVTALARCRRLLNLMQDVWVSEAESVAAYEKLAEIIGGADVGKDEAKSDVLGLMFLGLYVVILKELDLNALFEGSAPTLTYARMVTVAAAKWWQHLNNQSLFDDLYS